MKELKQTLMICLKDLSESMSTEMNPMDKDVLVKMVNRLIILIEENRLPKEPTFYSKVFSKILSGDVLIYKLNIINLMVIFRENRPDKTDRPL